MISSISTSQVSHAAVLRSQAQNHTTTGSQEGLYSCRAMGSTCGRVWHQPSGTTLTQSSPSLLPPFQSLHRSNWVSGWTLRTVTVPHPPPSPKHRLHKSRVPVDLFAQGKDEWAGVNTSPGHENLSPVPHCVHSTVKCDFNTSLQT